MTDAEKLAADYAWFVKVGADPEVVARAGIENGMRPDDIVFRILAVCPRPDDWSPPVAGS